MSQENVEIVRRALAAFSSGDADAFATLTTADVEWKTGLGAVEGEVFHGHDGVHTYFARLRSAWEAFRFLPDEFRDLGDVVLVLGRLEGLGRAGGVPIVSPVGAVWNLHEGKIRRLRAYLDQAEAVAVADAEGATRTALGDEPGRG
jgi:ketosteroid isomerase-like protein